MENRSEMKISARYPMGLMALFGQDPEVKRNLLVQSGLTASHFCRLTEEHFELDEFFSLLLAISNSFGEDWAISTANYWRQYNFGYVSQLSKISITLGDAIRTVIKFAKNAGVIFSYDLEISKDEAIFIFNNNVEMNYIISNPSLQIGYIAFHSILTVYSSHSMNEFLYFDFENPPPHYDSQIRQALGGTVTFNAPRNCIRFPAKWLEAESPLHDPAAFEFTQRQLIAWEAREANSTGAKPSHPKRGPSDTIPESAADRHLGPPLTHRQMMVLELILRGKTNQQIADQLIIALPTVKIHVGRILKAAGVRTRTQLVLLKYGDRSLNGYDDRTQTQSNGDD